MAHSIRGLQTTQTVVTQPVQWQLLLLLAEGSQSMGMIWQRLNGKQRWACWCGLWRLQRRQLVMFHVKQRRWALTPAGETLRPILTAIQKCTAIQKGGKSDDL